MMLTLALCAILLAGPALADMNINVPFLNAAPKIDGDLPRRPVWERTRLARTS